MAFSIDLAPSSFSAAAEPSSKDFFEWIATSEAIAWRPLDTDPNDFIAVSMLSLPTFWMSSKFLSMADLPVPPAGNRRSLLQWFGSLSREKLDIPHCTKSQ